jgi:hypothetical protein
VGLKTVSLENHLLKVSGVLTEVVPESGDMCEVSGAEFLGKSAREIRHRRQVIDQQVRSAILGEMGEGLAWGGLHASHEATGLYPFAANATPLPRRDRPTPTPEIRTIKVVSRYTYTPVGLTPTDTKAYLRQEESHRSPQGCDGRSVTSRLTQTPAL